MQVLEMTQSIEKIEKELKYGPIIMARYFELLEKIKVEISLIEQHIVEYYRTFNLSDCDIELLLKLSQRSNQLFKRMERFSQLPISIPLCVIYDIENNINSYDPVIKQEPDQEQEPEPDQEMESDVPFSCRDDYDCKKSSNSNASNIRKELQHLQELELQENLRTLEILNKKREELKQKEILREQELKKKEEELENHEKMAEAQRLRLIREEHKERRKQRLIQLKKQEELEKQELKKRTRKDFSEMYEEKLLEEYRDHIFIGKQNFTLSDKEELLWKEYKEHKKKRFPFQEKKKEEDRMQDRVLAKINSEKKEQRKKIEYFTNLRQC